MGLFTILFSLLLSTSVIAQGTGLSQEGSKFAAFKGANALTPHSFPTKRMKQGRWDLKVVPAYMAFKHDEAGQFQDMDGYGYAAGTTYALTNQLGLALLAVGFDIEGTGTTKNSGNGQWGENKASGTVLNVSAIWDPFKGGEENFHMPIMLGLSYLDLEETSALSVGTSSISTKRELSSPGLSVGIMGQWTLNSWFRLSPFVFVAEPFDDVTDTCTASGPSANCPTSLQSISKGTDGAGVEINIRPWNFSFQYLAPVDGMTTFTIKWETSFGG